MIAFLIAGMGGFMTVINCAYIGGLTGIVKRRGRGTPTVLVAGVRRGCGVRRVTIGCAGVLVAAAQPDLRIDDRQRQRPRRDTARISNGGWLPDMNGLAERLKSDFATMLDYWPC